MNSYDAGYAHIMKLAKLDLSKWHDLHPATRNAIGLGAAGGGVGLTGGAAAMMLDDDLGFEAPSLGTLAGSALGAGAGFGYRKLRPIKPAPGIIPGILRGVDTGRYRNSLPVGLISRTPSADYHNLDRSPIVFGGAEFGPIHIAPNDLQRNITWELPNMERLAPYVDKTDGGNANGGRVIRATPTVKLPAVVSRPDDLILDDATAQRLYHDPNLRRKAQSALNELSPNNANPDLLWLDPRHESPGGMFHAMLDGIGGIENVGVTRYDDWKHLPNLSPEVNEARRLVRTRLAPKDYGGGIRHVSGADGQALRDQLGLGYFEL